MALSNLKQGDPPDNRTKNGEDKVEFSPAEYTNVVLKIRKRLCKKLNMNVSFRTNDNFKNVLKFKIQKIMENYSDLCMARCGDCYKFYVGQTERRFIDRYKEHIPKSDIK